MMNSEVKAKWLEALRSGRYKQGSGYLKKSIGGEVSHCCLGVLGEIQEFGTVKLYFNADNTRRFSYCLLSDGEATSVDLDIEEQSKISRMNDQGLSFNEIADWIEENL